MAALLSPAGASSERVSSVSCTTAVSRRFSAELALERSFRFSLATFRSVSGASLHVAQEAVPLRDEVLVVELQHVLRQRRDRGFGILRAAAGKHRAVECRLGGHILDPVENGIVEAGIGEGAGNADAKRLVGTAGKHLGAVGAGEIGGDPFLELGDGRVGQQLLVGALPAARSCRRSSAPRRPAPGRARCSCRRPPCGGSRRAGAPPHRRSGRAARARIRAGSFTHQSCDEVGVHLRQAGHHAIGLQRAEHEFRIADLPPHRRLEQRHHARLENIAQRVVVSVGLGPHEFRRRRRAEQIPDCRPAARSARSPPRPWRRARRRCRAAPPMAGSSPRRGQRRLQRLELAGLRRDRVAVVEVGRGEQPRRPAEPPPRMRRLRRARSRCGGAAPAGRRCRGRPP